MAIFLAQIKLPINYVIDYSIFYANLFLSKLVLSLLLINILFCLRMYYLNCICVWRLL